MHDVVRRVGVGVVWRHTFKDTCVCVGGGVNFISTYLFCIWPIIVSKAKFEVSLVNFDIFVLVFI